MAITFSDNILYNIKAPVDARYYNPVTKQPWVDDVAVYGGILEANRYKGLTVAIANGTGIKEWWFKDDVTTLVEKVGNFSNANNGLSVSGGYVQLGGALTKTDTTVTGTDKNLTFTLDGSNRYSQLLLTKFFGVIQSGDLPNELTSTGSMSRLVIFKSTGGIWTNNYTSFAYNAQQRFLLQYPWTNNPTYNPSTGLPLPPALDDAHGFQIYDNLISTNQQSAIVSHYYDERVSNPYWQETYINNISALQTGKVYTIRTKASGDVFPSTMASSTKASPNGIGNAGWVFVYSGTSAGVTWGNGSIIDGDFPRIDRAAKSAIISADEDTNGKSIIRLDAKNTVIGQSVDAGNATYSLISGYSNSIISNGNYNVILGGGNSINHGTGSSVNSNASYAIGESNTITKFHSGAIGTNNENLGNYCHSIGYDLKVPAANTGTFQVGIFNDVFSVDYSSSLASPLGTHPSLSVGGGNQAALNPSAPKNLFHIMKDGLAKSYNGIDSRTGTRGITFPQWVTTGWEGQNPTGRAFGSPGKYIISNYGYIVGEGASGSGTTITLTSLSSASANISLGVITGALISIASGTGAFSTSDIRVSSYNSGTKTITITGGTITTPLSGARIRIGDNFINVIGTIIWGRTGLEGCVFYGNSTTSATLWSYGSTVIKVQRPTSPQFGEMGYNLTLNQLEYYNGSWVAI